MTAPIPSRSVSWRADLRSRTRDPKFLWRLAIGIMSAGLLIGFAARWLPESVSEALIGGRFDELSDHYDQVDQLAERGDWWAVWWMIPTSMSLAILPGPALIAGLAGVCWFVFLLQAGQPGMKDGLRWWLAIAGVLLGVLSIWPTLFSIYFQEQEWSVRPSTETIEGLRYFLVGVGFREELAKLLLFLPLVPFIIRRGSEREAMMVAGCVGLGFAREHWLLCWRPDQHDRSISNGQFLARFANRLDWVSILPRDLVAQAMCIGGTWNFSVGGRSARYV